MLLMRLTSEVDDSKHSMLRTYGDPDLDQSEEAKKKVWVSGYPGIMHSAIREIATSLNPTINQDFGTRDPLQWA